VRGSAVDRRNRLRDRQSLAEAGHAVVIKGRRRGRQDAVKQLTQAVAGAKAAACADLATPEACGFLRRAGTAISGQTMSASSEHQAVR